MQDQVPRLVRFGALCDVLAAGGDAREVLPGAVRDALQDAPQPIVMTDFAGRDSVAAAMAWLDANVVGTLVPVGDVVPTRYGEWSVYQANWDRMEAQVHRRFPQVRFAPWFILEDTDLWATLNARYLGEIVAKFGFFTPCIGCHLHFYAMRAVLGEALGATVLVSGEKEFHGSKRKANQTVEAVQGYAAFSDLHGVHQAFPIHGVRDEDTMSRLLGDGWREGERQLRCVMSGNDQRVDGGLVLTGAQIRAYMDQFAIPIAHRFVTLRRLGLTGTDLQSELNATARAIFGWATT
jgi:hypothetical protein